MTDAPANTLHVVGAIFTRDRSGPERSTEVLAFRRAAHKDAAGLWEFAGGKIEPGETPEQALAREIDEELGILVTVDEHLVTSDVWVAERKRHVSLACYFVTPLDSLPTASTDHDELRWMPLQTLHTLDWIAPDVPIVAALQARFAT